MIIRPATIQWTNFLIGVDDHNIKLSSILIAVEKFVSSRKDYQNALNEFRTGLQQNAGNEIQNENEVVSMKCENILVCAKDLTDRLSAFSEHVKDIKKSNKL